MTRWLNGMTNSPLLKLWSPLTEPSKSIRKPDERRQAQFLAALLLILIIMGIALILIPPILASNREILREPAYRIALGGIGMAVGAYFLSRGLHYKVGAILIIVTGVVGSFAVTVADINTVYYEGIVFLIFPILLTSILLSNQATLLLVILQAVGLVLLPTFFPQFRWDDLSRLLFGFVMVFSITVLLINHYRNMLEGDRQLEFQERNTELEKARDELLQLGTDLRREIADHQFAERVINETYAELEQRIAERTAELSSANALLQQQIAERSRAEAAEREQRILAEGLRDTAAAINSILDLDEILDRILIHIERILPYDSASIMMIESGVAYVVHGRGFAQRGLGTEHLFSLRLPLEMHGNLKEMFETGRPVIISDTQHVPLWHAVEETSWIRSSVGAPVRIEGKVIGFVNLDSTKPNTFTGSYAEKLLAFADQAGIAIHNARLFEAIREHAADLEASVEKRTAELVRERAQLQAITDSMNEGLFGQIQGEPETRYINAALLRMTGYSVGEWDFKQLVSSSITEIEYEERMQVVQKTVLGRGVWQGEWRLRRKDGSEFDAYLTTSRIDNQDGQPIGSVTLVRDISQEKVLQEQKSRFVANASHELRTPLTNLITRLYLLRKQPDHLDEHLAILDRVAIRMRNLVEDLLDFSRFERGVIPLKVRNIDICELVNDVIQIQEAEAQNKHILLQADLPEQKLIISADPERISQAVTNLVVNAITYTPEDGTVQVQVTEEANEAWSQQVVIHVRDTGSGIPPMLLPNIFLPFFRGSENNKGTGLGLAIAREIVEGHGGYINVESQPGKGSNFTIRLPFLTEGH